MDSAGRAVFAQISSDIPDVLHRKIMVLCGRGNNGGDGFVVARCFAEAGSVPEVVVVCHESDLRGDALQHYHRLLLRGVRPIFLNESGDWSTRRPDVLIDALLGTGTKGDLEGLALDVVKTINSWKSEGTVVVSVDIPSGLDGETGDSREAIMADITVTMGLPKLGLLVREGKHYVGRLHVADIGFPPDLTDGGDVQLIEPRDVCSLFPRRYHHSHKYDFGRVLIVAGSRGMTGAAVLCARAALRSGAGMVRVAMPESVVHVIEHGVPEALTMGLPETTAGSISSEAAMKLQEHLNWCEVLAIGPGLSRHPETLQAVQDILLECKKPAVVDADGLMAWSLSAELTRGRGFPTVITPHTGEFKVLAGMPKGATIGNRLEASQSFVRRTRVTLLLKGSPTVVTDSSGRSYITNTGNPGMATPGSGDVLTGMISAFLGQGLTVEQAAYGAAYLHGLAGDLAREVQSEPGLLAGDLIDWIPAAFRTTGVW